MNPRYRQLLEQMIKDAEEQVTWARNRKSSTNVFEIHVREGRGTNQETSEPRQAKELHDAYVVLEQETGVEIEISQLTDRTNLPNFTAENSFTRWFDNGLMWRVTLKYDPDNVRNYGFAGRVEGPDAYPLLRQAYGLASRSPLQLLVNANSGIITEYQNFSQVFPTISPLYALFYPKYPTQHFLQFGEYTKTADHPVVSVPAFPCLDNWSEYSMAYGYAAIYEHEVTKSLSDNLEDQKFLLRVMEKMKLWY